MQPDQEQQGWKRYLTKQNGVVGGLGLAIAVLLVIVIVLVAGKAAPASTTSQKLTLVTTLAGDGNVNQTSYFTIKSNRIQLIWSCTPSSSQALQQAVQQGFWTLPPAEYPITTAIYSAAGGIVASNVLSTVCAAGNTSGIATVDVGAGQYYLDIGCGGSWQITVSDFE